MNSSLLNRIGLGSFDPGYLFVIVIVFAVLLFIVMILLIVQISKVSKLKKRLDKFIVGKDGLSLEQEIIGFSEEQH